MYISPAEYHTWAQQSLNRVSERKIKVNGISHESYPEYKALVRKCQKLFLVKVSGVVDEPTQNFLITNNHIDPPYSKWIRQSLAKISGDSSLLKGSGQSAELVKAIKKYQDSKKKQKLSVDGWVGVKTELCLALEGGVKIPEPGIQPPAPVPVDIRVGTWLEELEDDLADGIIPVPLPYQVDPRVDDRKAFRRFVNRLGIPSINDEYFDWKTAQDYLRNRDMRPGDPYTVPPPASLQKLHALRHLRHLVATGVNPAHPKAYSHFIWKCWEVFLDVEYGMFQTLYEANRSSVSTLEGRAKAIVDWTDARVQSQNSILSAWPSWKSWSGTPWWIS